MIRCPAKNRMIDSPTENEKRKRTNIFIRIKDAVESKCVIKRWCDYGK